MNTCILLIDEDEDDRELFLIALDETGIKDVEVVQSYDGSHALKLLAEGLHPDYIFVDLNMPQVNGIQFLERVKKSENSEIPVVVYSTSNLADDKKRTHELGAIHFITKPNTIRELRNDIDDVLHHKYDVVRDN